MQKDADFFYFHSTQEEYNPKSSAFFPAATMQHVALVSN